MEEPIEVVRVLEWNFVEVPIYNGTAQGPQMMRDAPKRIEVKCGCGANFEARQSWRELQKGTFYRYPMSLQITCSGCGKPYVVPATAIPQN